MIKKEADKFSSELNILEGMVSLSALFSARESGINDRPVEKVLFDRKKLASKRREYEFLKRKSERHGFSLIETDAAEIDGMTVGSTHGGVVGICGERTLPPLDMLTPESRGFYVMIEGVEDPYNFGYALRSLYAAGVSAVILPPRNWLGVSGIVARASAGASELFSFYTSQDAANAAAFFKTHGISVVCTDRDSKFSVYDAPLAYPLFLIIGGEKRGISKAVLSEADMTVRLDYARPFAASLSAASAASVIAFEVMRKNMG